MVSVNLITSGAQKTYLVTVKSQETDSNYSASVRTQHSGRAKTAIKSAVMELSCTMESDAGALNSIVTIQHICFLFIVRIKILVIFVIVKTKVIRYLKDIRIVT